jgi:glycosyltransferase involved in cell wall biosynthesis
MAMSELILPEFASSPDLSIGGGKAVRQILRILIVIEPGIDGAFRHVEGLVRFLMDCGQEVHIAYSDRRGSKELLQLVELVESRGRTLNLGVSNQPSPRDLTALLRLRRFAGEIKPDIIHGHSSKAGILSRSLSFLGIKAAYFYTPHAYYGLAQRPGCAVKFYNQLERLFARIGTTINISVDERRFATDTLRIPPGGCVSIHNPVDAHAFVPGNDETRKVWREAHQLPVEAVVLGSMGRLSFQKDPQTLYRAFARFVSTGADVYLYHVGQGELQEELDALAKSLGLGKRLIRSTYCHQPATFYQVLDGFIVTSRYEAGWPLVVLEALASDLPIVTGTGPGTRHISEAGLSHCWTADVGEEDLFSSAISAWFEDRKKRRPSNHRTIALKQFSTETCFGAVLDQYFLKLEANK